MSKWTKILAVVCGSGLAAISQVSAITLGFGAVPGTGVSFSGGNFTFTSVGGYQFSVSSITDGSGSALGLMGYIDSTSPFTIGAITVNGSDQVAPVNGSATLHIADGVSIDLLGTIQWIDIKTSGTGGSINVNGLVNVTGLTYGGSNPDLTTLAASGSAIDVVSFTFVPPLSLTDLITSRGGFTSYSGSISSVSVPDAEATAGLMGLGILSFAALCRRRRNP